MPAIARSSTPVTVRQRLRAPWTVAVVLVLVCSGSSVDAVASAVRAAHWLQAPGAALIGAGLAVLVSNFASQEAIREQYHKDANLRRRDEFYVPLHTDLKGIVDRLNDARSGRDGLVQVIGVTAEASEDFASVSTLRAGDGISRRRGGTEADADGELTGPRWYRGPPAPAMRTVKNCPTPWDLYPFPFSLTLEAVPGERLQEGCHVQSLLGMSNGQAQSIVPRPGHHPVELTPNLMNC